MTTKVINKYLKYKNHTRYTANNTAFKYIDLKHQATYKKTQLKKFYITLFKIQETLLWKGLVLLRINHVLKLKL